MKQSEAQWQSTLRFAVGVTAAFVLCEFLKWLPSFLAAALVMLLGAIERATLRRMGLAR